MGTEKWGRKGKRKKPEELSKNKRLKKPISSNWKLQLELGQELEERRQRPTGHGEGLQFQVALVRLQVDMGLWWGSRRDRALEREGGGLLSGPGLPGIQQLMGNAGWDGVGDKGKEVKGGLRFNGSLVRLGPVIRQAGMEGQSWSLAGENTDLHEFGVTNA